MTHDSQSVRNERANLVLLMVVRFGCEAFFYGCFTVLFAVSIYLMFRPPRRGTGANKPILIITGLLYLSCSAHFALNFGYCSQNLAAIVTDDAALVKKNDTALEMGLDLLISVTSSIGELILIYRCWLLWSRNYWIIILPSLLSFSTIVCIGVYLRLLLDPKSPIRHILGFPIVSLPLCTNVILTTLIAGRIWYLSPCDAQFQTGTGRAAIKIIIESGMLNLAVQIIYIIFYAIRHPAKGIVGMNAVQIYGISATLIIIRASLCVSNNIQSGTIRNGLPSFVAQPTSSTQVHIEAISFTAARRLLDEMTVSKINWKPSSEV